MNSTPVPTKQLPGQHTVGTSNLHFPSVSPLSCLWRRLSSKLLHCKSVRKLKKQLNGICPEPTVKKGKAVRAQFVKVAAQVVVVASAGCLGVRTWKMRAHFFIRLGRAMQPRAKPYLEALVLAYQRGL